MVSGHLQEKKGHYHMVLNYVYKYTRHQSLWV